LGGSTHTEPEHSVALNPAKRHAFSADEYANADSVRMSTSTQPGYQIFAQDQCTSKRLTAQYGVRRPSECERGRAHSWPIRFTDTARPERRPPPERAEWKDFKSGAGQSRND